MFDSALKNIFYVTCMIENHVAPAVSLEELQFLAFML